MTGQKIVTLIEVIAKVKNISDAEFQSKVYDNILTIFNRLNTKEKKVLLKGLINICFIVEDKVLINTSDLVEVKEAVKHAEDSITAGVVTVEEYNQLELIRLKSWLVKVIASLLLTGLMGFMLITAVLNPGHGISIGILDNLFKILKVIFAG